MPRPRSHRLILSSPVRLAHAESRDRMSWRMRCPLKSGRINCNVGHRAKSICSTETLKMEVDGGFVAEVRSGRRGQQSLGQYNENIDIKSSMARFA